MNNDPKQTPQKNSSRIPAFIMPVLHVPKWGAMIHFIS